MGNHFLPPLLAGGLCLALSGCAPPPAEVPAGHGLFSWSAEAIHEDSRDALLGDMAQQGLTVLYQTLPGETGQLQPFLQAAQARGVTVYALTGDPDWGLDPDGEALCAAVDEVIALNAALPEDCRIRGVLMDTEPYLTDEWEEDREGVMEAFVSGMVRARQRAAEGGLAYLACIPYYYDTWGLEEPLSRLIEEGCDGLTIMNYYKEGEALHIETEVALAQAAGRPVTVIYELQPPGRHGLTGANTYYEDGLEAVTASFQALTHHFDGAGLSYALHDYDALREVTDRA